MSLLAPHQCFIGAGVENAVIEFLDVIVKSLLQGPKAAPPDREPQTAPQEISTAPVTAVGFASINVEIRTELEKRVLYAL
jgi:hypothetical protein